MISLQDTAYPCFSEIPSQQELINCFIPNENEIKFANDQTQKGGSRIGFMLLLKCFQRLGYFVQTEDIPEIISEFVSKKLGISLEKCDFKSYDQSNTRTRHMPVIREFINVKSFDDDGENVLSRACHDAALVKDSIIDIINSALEILVRERFEIPAFSTLFREAQHQRVCVYNEIYIEIHTKIGASGIAFFDHLFVVDQQTRISQWEMIKFETPNARYKAISELINHVNWLRTLSKYEHHIDIIPRLKLDQLAIEARSKDVSDIMEVEEKRRISLILALIKVQKSRSIDQLLNLFTKLMGRLYYKSKADLAKYVEKNQQKTDEIIKMYASIEDIITGNNNKKQLSKIKQIYKDYKQRPDLAEFAKAHSNYGGKHHIQYMAKHFKKSRSLIFRILSIFQFVSTSQDESLENALEFIISHRDSRLEKLNPSERSRSKNKSGPLLNDLSWMSNEWWKIVTGNRERNTFPSEIFRKQFEICVCSQLSRELKSGDMCVVESSEYGDFRRELLPLSECEKTLASYGEQVGLPVEKIEFIAHIKKLLTESAAKTDETFPINDDFTIVNGEPHLKRIKGKKKTKIDDEASEMINDKLKSKSMPLLDILVDTAKWLNWHKPLGPHSGHDGKIKDDILRYAATVFAYGTGMGPKEGEDVLQDLTARQLQYTNDYHVTPEKIDEMTVVVINAYSKLILPQYWGDANRAAADGTHWNLSRHNAFAEHHIRYGQWGGIAYYHVSDTYIVLFSKFIPCGVYEAIHIFDVLMNKKSAIKPNTLHGDTHAQSEAAFGLAFLLGIKLMPRIRSWQNLKFYKPSPEYSYKNIENLFSKDAAEWNLIEKHLPDMFQVAQSIKAGRISPSTIMRRLGTASKKNKLYFAFSALGRIVRTTFLLHYLRDSELRHIIQGTTNKCEQFNKYVKWIHYAADFIKENKLDEQQKIIKYNHLIANLLTFHTTYKMTEALVHLEKEGRPISENIIARMSPYRTCHIKRFGKMHLALRNPPPPDFGLHPSNLKAEKVVP